MSPAEACKGYRRACRLHVNWAFPLLLSRRTTLPRSFEPADDWDLWPAIMGQLTQDDPTASYPFRFVAAWTASIDAWRTEQPRRRCLITSKKALVRGPPGLEIACPRPQLGFDRRNRIRHLLLKCSKALSDKSPRIVSFLESQRGKTRSALL